jgi:hypothetical protein
MTWKVKQNNVKLDVPSTKKQKNQKTPKKTQKQKQGQKNSQKRKQKETNLSQGLIWTPWRRPAPEYITHN